jgi:EAL domain-containing protein (putative c-di-GMP-specific phosphodiesterase class I)
MHARVARELEVRTALGDAIEAGELALDYQPIVGLPDGRLLGVEALLRWRHPRWGWVKPDEFIPIAEQSDLIVRLADFVLAQAALQAREWRTEFPAGLPWGVAVNLSRRELADSQFVGRFERIVREQGADACDLAIEVTERVFLDETDGNLAKNLLALSELGARLSLDDFGSGYSAMASLKRFPFSLVKIDRSFISGIRRASSEAPVTRAVTALAHVLGMQVIAEGVETELQAAYLHELECDAAQGFHFARPQAACGIRTLLRATSDLGAEASPPTP